MHIGVVIPTFIRDIHNGCLQRCLDSIERQTKHPDIVAISASSCTESDVRAVFRASYSFPIRLQVSEKSQSAATNRNIGIQLLADCTLDVVSFFDSDDEMFPFRLEYIERAFQESNSDYTLHNYIDLTSPPTEHIQPLSDEYQVYQDAFLPDNRPYCGIYIRPELAIIRPYAHQAHVSVKKELLTEYAFKENTNSIAWEDSQFVRSLAHRGLKGSYIYTTLSIYHRYPK